ncbi:MAG: hypothetical protein EOP35_19060 [Rubrivivax sp.]|nr:MAG: hypothetical protein EOP35_19060 [Rubrivivax sp.]
MKMPQSWAASRRRQHPGLSVREIRYDPPLPACGTPFALSRQACDVRPPKGQVMQVQVETDNHVEGREKLIEHVEGVIRDAVDRYAEQVTHVEAHLGDVNSGDKSGADDMRCMLEARVAGVKNIAVKHQAESLHMAIEGAADKLTKALESTLGKLHDRERRHAGTGELSAELVRNLDDVEPPAT